MSGEWLRDHIGEPGLLVVDVRWYLDGRSGEAAYRQGHIPGAVFCDLDRDLAGKPGTGRHPLPERGAFAEAMSRLGVGPTTRVVAYDDQGGSVAGRLWWLLRHFGHPAAAVLDGGLDSWAGELQQGWIEPQGAPFSPQKANDFVALEWEEVARLGPEDVLLDARAPERYRGETEPIDPKAGHIPGARSAFWKDNLDADGRFLKPEVLRRRYRELGVNTGREVVAYCGSGVTSCHAVLALEAAGLTGARLYVGSWSDWSSRDLPVEVGETLP